jgi:hypothetical protein
MAMLARKFDAYGEVLPESAGVREQSSTASAYLSRIGQYAFWLLVVVIVFARIVYHPGIA